MPVRTLAPKRVDLGAVPHRLEEGKSASENAGPGGVVDCDVSSGGSGTLQMVSEPGFG